MCYSVTILLDYFTLFLSFQNQNLRKDSKKVHCSVSDLFIFYLFIDILDIRASLYQTRVLQLFWNVQFLSLVLIDDVAFKEKQMYSGWWGLSRETISLLYIYDIIIFSMTFSFVLCPFQYHNAMQKAQMRYRLLHI